MHTLGRATPALLLAVAAALAGTGAARAGTPSCDGAAATIVGSSRADRLVGTSGRDVIVGLGGNDTILGRGGDDLICGGAGADVIHGGPGDDRLYGGLDRLGGDQGGSFLRGDTIYPGSGDDYVDLGYDSRAADQRNPPDVVSYANATSGVHVDLSAGPGYGIAKAAGTDRIRVRGSLGVVGSRYADTLIGSPGPDYLVGNAGDDTINAHGGADQIYPDGAAGPSRTPDDDVVDAGPGADTVISWAGRDSIYGGTGDDHLSAFSRRASRAYGGAGDDTVDQYVTGSTGWVSDGGTGSDRLVLYVAPSLETKPLARVSVDLRSDSATVSTVAATGTVGGFEDYTLIGDVRWYFYGTDSPDSVWANSVGTLHAWTYGGDDVIRGTSGNDYLNAGAGYDTVYGMGGTDTCVDAEKAVGC